MKLVIVDGTSHERVDCRVWELADAKGAMALLLPWSALGSDSVRSQSCTTTQVARPPG